MLLSRRLSVGLRLARLGGLGLSVGLSGPSLLVGLVELVGLVLLVGLSLLIEPIGLVVVELVGLSLLVELVGLSLPGASVNLVGLALLVGPVGLSIVTSLSLVHGVVCRLCVVVCGGHLL